MPATGPLPEAGIAHPWATAGEGAPTFREPWEAQAFSMAVGLAERGLFSWPEWTETLGAVIADPRSVGTSYYEQWLLALETLLKARCLITEEELAARREAWRAAALTTPHGEPIVLRIAPEGEPTETAG